MSKHLEDRAPITGIFTKYWNRVAKRYVSETENVDIPWVTFDGKTLTQTSYRLPIQTRVEFTDPVTGRKVKNIYEAMAEDGKLVGKYSLQRAGIGTGVNGNHMNDATIVRMFHLWGREKGIPTATIHDAFFTNIGDADLAKNALREIYAQAVESDSLRKTLQAMRKAGMSKQSYDEFIREAKELGLLDPEDGITGSEVVAGIAIGQDWYGIGP